jgi:hypothetical protein
VGVPHISALTVGVRDLNSTANLIKAAVVDTPNFCLMAVTAFATVLWARTSLTEISVRLLPSPSSRMICCSGHSIHAKGRQAPRERMVMIRVRMDARARGKFVIEDFLDRPANRREATSCGIGGYLDKQEKLPKSRETRPNS